MLFQGVLLMHVNSLANAFAYWQGQPAEDAHKTYFDDMAQTINHIQKLAGENANKIQVITGETGWPTSKNPPRK